MRKTLLASLLLFFNTLAFAQVNLSGTINQYAKVSNIDYCAKTLTVVDATGFAPGTDIIIIQMQGALINTSDNSSFGNIQDLRSTGLYERARIQAIAGNVISLEFALLNQYNLDGSVQIVSLPSYPNATVIDSIVAPAWDGNRGGVLVLEVADTLTLEGNISVYGRGFRGGFANISQSNNCSFLTNQNDYYYGLNNWRGAAKGEGVALPTPGREAGRGAQANGGGGGNDHNAGGGGGGNISAGGNGGNNEEPNAFGCDGTFPGVGGKALPELPERLYMGGGGGAGHENNDVGTNGACGGGIIILIAKNIKGNNYVIDARGMNVTEITKGDGAGGGGSGGTVLIDVENIASQFLVDARGGNGGSVDNNNENRCQGPGGGGSGGRVILPTGLPINILVIGGDAGRSFNSSAGSCPDGTNGAQVGEDGFIADFEAIPKSNSASTAPLIVNQPQNQDACTGEALKLLVEASGSGLQFQWQVNQGAGFQNLSNNATYSGTNSAELNIANATPELTNYTFRLQINSICGGPIFSDPISLNIAASPTAQFDFVVDKNMVQFSNNSINSEGFAWDFGDGSTSNEAAPSHTYVMDGDYTVTLSAFGTCDTISVSQTLTIFSQPSAAFTANVTEGCTPLNVTFQNNSSANTTNFFWIFEGANPGTSIDQNPIVTYTISGTYDVILVANNESGSDTLILENYITVNPLPTAGFLFTTNNLTSSFTNTSANADSYFWDFGDGNTSTSLNPSHTYPEDGAYEVMLSAINACDTATFSQTITIATLPTAAFTANVTEGCTPLSVNLQNNSSSSATSFAWVLPGAMPGFSTQRNPSVVYNMPGIYNITLIASNATGVDTLILENYITVSKPPVADFTSVVNNLNVNFTNNSANGDTYLWNFGDGNTSTVANPNHVYNIAGNYNVILVVNNECGNDTISKNITAGVAPSALFTLNRQNGCAPHLVTFSDASSGAYDTRTWAFPGGNPATSTEPNPMVRYDTPGRYNVTLTVTGPLGSSTITQESYINVLPQPAPAFDFTVSGNTVTFMNASQNATSVFWNFGDGATSIDQNPVHTYTTGGVYTVTLNASNAYCGKSISRTFAVGLTDVEDLRELGILVFPNPMRNYLYINAETFSKELQYKLYTANGQLRNEGTFRGRLDLDVSNYANGLYIMQLQNNNQTWLIKLLKQ